MVFPDCPQAGRCPPKRTTLASEPRHSPVGFPTYLARLDSDNVPSCGGGVLGWTPPDRQRTVLAGFAGFTRPRLALQVTRIRAVDAVEQLVDRENIRKAGFVDSEGNRGSTFGIRFLDTGLALQGVIQRCENLVGSVV